MGHAVPSVWVVDFLAAFDHEAGLLSTAARRDETAAVPTCPGWDVDELLRHLGQGFRLAEVLVRERRTDPPDRSMFPAQEGGALEGFEAGRAALVTTLRAADPATPVWTFGAEQSVAFWLRRITHETLVHRVDTELATGARSPIDTGLALDGIDEWCTVLLPLRTSGQEPLDATLHLHATDAEGEWLLRFAGGTVTVERGHAKGDAAVRGEAADLYRWLWGRGDLDALEVFGDPSVARAPGRYRF